MAKIETFAELVGSEVASKAVAVSRQVARPGRPAGVLLGELLEANQSGYSIRLPLTERDREILAILPGLTSNRAIADALAVGEVVISLEHLRSFDPKTTRITCGYRVDYSDAEVEVIRQRMG